MKKKQLINSKKQKKRKVDSFFNQKANFLKYFKYDLLSYKFLDYENKTECFLYGFPFQRNKNQEISYNIPKETFFYMLRNIPINLNHNNYLINNYLGKGDILYMEKTTDRKYLDWKILNFDLGRKVDIETWMTIDTNENTQIRTKNSQIIHKKDLFYLMIPETNLPNCPKGFFDWMGMNEKTLKSLISNLEFWFFPEFLSLYTAYKMKPWFIPSKLLLLTLNRNSNSSENKNINEKESFLITSNRNQEEREPTSRSDLGSVLLQQKDIDENYTRSYVKKGKNKKQSKSNTEAELDFFLKQYLLFQLRWNNSSNQSMINNNINLYCLLLKLIDPRKITISSIQQREMRLDIMLIQRSFTLPELMKKGILIIEPIHLFGKKDGQFIMYQTIGISLVHKSKYKINQNCQKERYISKKRLDQALSPHQRITGNRDKNHFDLLVPENILSLRRRRKLRILICFNSKTRNDVDKNPVFCNEKSIKNIDQVSHNHLDREKNQLMQLKLFLWPNYRLEDLACMNYYWFDTNNGTRFSMLRVHLYPQLTIRR